MSTYLLWEECDCALIAFWCIYISYSTYNDRIIGLGSPFSYLQITGAIGDKNGRRMLSIERKEVQDEIIYNARHPHGFHDEDHVWTRDVNVTFAFINVYMRVGAWQGIEGKVRGRTLKNRGPDISVRSIDRRSHLEFDVCGAYSIPLPIILPTKGDL